MRMPGPACPWDIISRGLAGQHMAGIDDIGGQVLPQQEDARGGHFQDDRRKRRGILSLSAG